MRYIFVGDGKRGQAHAFDTDEGERSNTKQYVLHGKRV